MQSREFLHLVDAGLAINSPYPLVLPPAREAHLILSFDFSAGDPLEVTEKKPLYLREGDELTWAEMGMCRKERRVWLGSGHWAIVVWGTMACTPHIMHRHA